MNATSDLSDRTNASKPSRLSEEETNKEAAGKLELLENSPGAGASNALLNIVISGNEGTCDRELEEFKKIENSLSAPSSNTTEQAMNVEVGQSQMLDNSMRGSENIRTGASENSPQVQNQDDMNNSKSTINLDLDVQNINLDRKTDIT